jgi:uncharacterized protein (TIGR02145 family)
MKKHIPALFLFLALFPALALLSQSPLGIPYQAVMRNADGSVMASSEAVFTFMIHDGTANGTVVYQESHSLTSNTQGLVSCVVGNGVVSQGSFSNINWGSGAKFLHVMMGTTDLGTQQMLSVPYALYAGNTAVRVSATGDTLTVGGNSVIVPGISAANPQVQSNGGLGAQVLAGNTTCANEYISVTGCGGQTSLTYDGRTYDLVEIGGQCWFADNLATDQYRNGDPIPTGLSNTTWQNTTAGAYAIYNNDPVNDSIYGKLYNWYTTVDSRGLCPSGWHVPTDCEWMYLEGSLGMPLTDQETAGWRGVIGGEMKATSNWTYLNLENTNSSGFAALPGGYRFNDIYSAIGIYCEWWSSTEFSSIGAWPRRLDHSSSLVGRVIDDKRVGLNIRCIKDLELSPMQGCTDGAACNFMVNANEDDGSCLYVNAKCDDGNANTINDMINGNCECTFSILISGCTNSQACNFNASANLDDGSCLIQGTACNDGNHNTSNDLVNVSCVCDGTALGNGVYSKGNGVTDVEGNVYTSFIINGQEWMQQNLAVTKYRNGDSIPTGLSNTYWQNTTSGAFAIYNNSPANNSTYGNLYNWYAVNDSRGLCPESWHVPSDAEWSSLINYLDPSGDNALNISGGKMKAIIGWYFPNTDASNISGFTGAPGGCRLNFGSYGYVGNAGYWWSGTDDDTTFAWSSLLFYNYSDATRTANDKRNGFSVRCLRD